MFNPTPCVTDDESEDGDDFRTCSNSKKIKYGSHLTNIPTNIIYNTPTNNNIRYNSPAQFINRQKHEYQMPKGYKVVGQMMTNGKVNGSKVLRGPNGGEYYINSNGNPSHISPMKKHLIWQYGDY
jgi:hypothetical protein